MFHLPQILDAILVALLLYAIVTDVRERIIPHWVNITIALMAPIGWWVHGFHLWPDVAYQIAQSLGLFAFFLLAQAIGQMGGGDVKLIAALGLWFNWQVMFSLIFLMSIAGGVLTIGMWVHHKLRKREGKPEYPYGIAIVTGALIVVLPQHMIPIFKTCEHYFNHFS